MIIHELKIGELTLENNVLLAPMAGVTDRAFRIITKPFGPALMYTEMVSGKGLYYKSRKTADLLESEEDEGPVAVQIFGHEPEIMAQIAEKAASFGAVMIDINMGCPAPKIVGNGDGSALMKSPKLAGEVVAAVSSATSLPVTVKIRAGWDEDSVNATEVAKIAEENGAAAVAVHGRTRKQFYSGEADLDVIRDVVRAVSIPVVGNGDICGGRSAARMLEYTGCAGIMVGRAAEGNPWVFRDILHYLSSGEECKPPNMEERLSVALAHFELLLRFKGERRGVLESRRHMSHYFKGVRGGAALRERINRIDTPEEMRSVLTEFGENYDKYGEQL